MCWMLREDGGADGGRMEEEVGYYTTVAADPGPVFALLLLSSPLPP